MANSTQLVRVFYATNRELVDDADGPDFGNGFHRDSPNNLRFGWADVERRTVDDYAVQSVCMAADPTAAKSGAALGNAEDSVSGSQGTFDMLRNELDRQQNCDVLCFLHGYASDFKTSLERAAEISDNYSTKDKPLIGFVFSWPSNGRMVPWLDYYFDRDDARNSGLAIARAFKLLIDFVGSLKHRPCGHAIHLVAHSMGNWALSHALDDIQNLCGNRLPRIFDKIFLMAADVDNDALEENKRLSALPRLCKAIAVYFSADDRALMISDFTKFNDDRLGATGPRRRENIDRRISLVDCHLVDEPDSDRSSEEQGKRYDASVHQYYRLRKEVIEDVRMVLSGMPHMRIPGRRYLDDDRSFEILPFSERVSS